MRSRREIVAGLASIAATASLAACGAGSSGSGGKTTITYFSWNNEKTMTPIVQAFEKANPTVHVDISTAQGRPTTMPRL